MPPRQPQRSRKRFLLDGGEGPHRSTVAHMLRDMRMLAEKQHVFNHQAEDERRSDSRTTDQGRTTPERAYHRDQDEDARVSASGDPCRRGTSGTAGEASSNSRAGRRRRRAGSNTSSRR